MATIKRKTVMFMGRSGSGKGTQAKRVVDTLKAQTGREVFYLESGQSFRDFIAQGGYSARLSKAVMDSGALQPSFLAVWNWSHLLVDNLTGEEHLVVDGTPRSLEEAKVLDTAFDFYGLAPFAFVYLNVSPTEGKKRLQLRARDDDQTDEKINERFRWFDQSVMPVIDHYRSHPGCRFVEVDGDPDIETVTKLIAESLTDYLNS
ncbi:MAG: hypothetical protein COV09_00840 [Candidatus Vogelbacteria bacterium CG10_big_fil_rev_8_21_14_0_10_50_13]|uniref:Adenylate kinase n=1 Tax=Candidatus Vogelbacteria bacterium CG10_big_fil_rev_8_21_14_0_10_50_13 TaxID=1975044 RepID=A0A2H0RGK9_9BACT|nr:MAG: hypothetical protein COV09_00840 [Candidatus Vogelbacteria bacterium CG10_big_fil_rev_8_21_14_0_10_50_13]